MSPSFSREHPRGGTAGRERVSTRGTQMRLLRLAGLRGIGGPNRPRLKALPHPADAHVMVDSPRFLFQHTDLAHVRTIVNMGYYCKDGVEYERLYVSAGDPDQQEPGVALWAVLGYPKRTAFLVSSDPSRANSVTTI